MSEAPDPATDALAAYRERRNFARTPEPAADTEAVEPDDGERPRFVIQHHLASRLHHDLRLEHGGTAASWAVPKGLPDLTGLRHLAVQTEDHPLAYLDFSGDIPEGEYGAGPMRIWDAGTYEPLEWRDDKVTICLHGHRHRGEYHLFRTDGDDPSQWLVVRRDEPTELVDPPPQLSPMLAADGGGRAFDDPGWVFEIKWDGVRAVATVTRPGAGEEAATHLVSRNGNDVSSAYPELASLWERVLARNAVLDGEIVALGKDGKPSFQRLQRRMHVRASASIDRLRREVPVTYMVFDLLAVDGQPLTDLPLSQRLAHLDDVLVPGGAIARSDQVAEQGRSMFAAAAEHGLEGLIAKRLEARYRPGKRSRDWLKLKVRRRADVVIGGWAAGEGSRSGKIGSLLVGAYDGDDLHFVGRVGTGFDAAELSHLDEMLADRATDTSPFTAGPSTPRDARFVHPDLACRVEYAEVTDEGILRAPAYKGLIDDADPTQATLAGLRP